MASYYSNRLHGRRMSDGTRYHRDSLICAHKKYELGTMLKVTNIKNGKSVVVRVADRCSGRRIIDLSYAAAEEIDIISSGVAMVKVEKYKMERGIPYKREIDDDLPELDFEITEKDSYFKPNWGRNDRKNKEKEKKRHKMNNKNNKK